MKINYKYILICLALFLAGMGLGFVLKKTNTVTETVKEYERVNVPRDTTIVVKESYTLPVEYKEKFVTVTDTVIVNNTVYVRDTLQTYEINERDYDLVIDAVRMDDYRLDIHAKYPVTVQDTFVKETQYNRETLNNTRYDNISWGFQGGMGLQYDLLQRRLGVGPYIGVGVQIRF